VCIAHKRALYKGAVIGMDGGSTARDKMIAAYSLVCLHDTDLDRFKEYLDEYSSELIEAAVADVLDYLGVGEEVRVEVVHLTKEQREKLEASDMLDTYLTDKDKEDYDS
jgi:hypothetical protein